MDLPKKKIFIPVACTILAALLILTYVSTSKVYAVRVDGKTVAKVKNKQVYEKVKEEIKTKYQEKYGHEVEFNSDIKLEPVKALGTKVCTAQELTTCLEKSLKVQVKAIAIKINDQQVAFVDSKKDADAVLKGVKEHYVNSVSEGELIKVEVLEKIKLVEEFTNPNNILAVNQAKDLILNGSTEYNSYEVKEGESLWTIARQHKIPVEELIEANPQVVAENKLKIGDKINLTASKPLLNVTVVKNITYEETIPYNEETVKDSKLWKWQKKVKQQGQNGTKEIVAQVVFKNGNKVSQTPIEEKVVKEPIKQIVCKGTKSELASRGSGGRFMWPTTGNISSPFGQRGRGFHTGIDIAKNSGATVKAANSGTVTFAGRSGGYGNLVIINHGGGFQTYYAHLSSIKVSKGQSVSKGQNVGNVGSTGRSTGPHLHFEVRVNGSAKNPLLYLGK